MNPYVYSCSAIGGILTLKNLILAAITFVCLYFGWPIIEAIIIVLPIPDPKELKEKFMRLVSRKSEPNNATTGGKKPASGKAGYSGNFN